MRRFGIFSVSGLALASVFGCGDGGSSSDPGSQGLVQSVSELPYTVESVELEAEIVDSNRVSERLSRKQEQENGLPGEKASRLYDQDNDVLFLAINGEGTPFNVALSGDFKREKAPNTVVDVCELKTRTKVEGKAGYDELKIDFELEAELIGKDCPPSISDEYISFIDDELDNLNINYINNLRETGIWKLPETRRVKILVRVRGSVDAQ